MKRLQFFLTFCFFSFICFSALPQAISKGVIKKELTAKEGTITIYLPDDMRPGDMISGTVAAEPAGKTEKEKNKNLKQLEKYKVEVAGSTINLLAGQRQKVNIPSLMSNPVAVLKNEKNNPLSTINISISPGANIPQAKAFLIPTHALTGDPIRITGPFDGDASNTKCRLDGKEMEVLAESPRQTICDMPQTTSGPHTITVEEKGKTTEQKVSAVNLELTAAKTNLLRGESTQVTVRVTGLQGIDKTIPLTITNISPSTITMTGGNTQVINLTPSQVGTTGTFTQNFTVQSLNTGDFSVSADLDLPQPESISQETTNKWVVCTLNGISCILPMERCEALHNGLTNQPPPIPPGTDAHNIGSVNTISEKEGVIEQNFSLTDMIADRVAFTYSSLNSSVPKNDTVLYDLDILSADGFHSYYPSSFINNGVYNMTSVAYYGSNQTVVQNSIIVVPSQPQRPSVSNNEIEKLKKREQELRDSLNNINRRIQNGTNQMNDNYRQRHLLDSLRWVQQSLYAQLYNLDQVIDRIPGTYGPGLTSLLDSLDRFNKKIGGLNGQGLQDALDKMSDEVKKLENALNACLAHLAALQKEQQDLANEKSQIESDQEQAYHDILDACRNAGYNAGGSSGRDRNSGEFKYNYGLIMRGDNGDYEFVRGIPAQALKKVSELEKKIKDGNKRIGEINARQKQLPGEIAAAKKECDELSRLLAAAKAAQQKGKNALAEYNFNMADLAELCREINALLEPLANWCAAHPGECSSFESQLKNIMADCPKNIGSLPNFMNALNNIIAEKKKKEDEHKKKADQLSGQINEIDKKNNGIGTQIGNDTQKGRDYGGALGKTMSDIDKAIADEIARRQQADAQRKAELKRICIEFLKSQASSPEEADMIEEIAKVKDQMQKMAEDIKTASEWGDRITKDKLKDLTDKLREQLDKMLEEFEKFDKLKGKLDQLKEIKQDLETVFKSNKSAKENAEAMGVVLKRIKEQLDKVADEFPIMKLFTAYFGFMVDAFNTITTKANQIVEDYVAKLVRMALDRTDCMVFINEYMKNNSVDDAVRKAYDIYKRSETSVLTDTPERRRMLEEQLRKYVLQKMTDCCLRWATQ